MGIADRAEEIRGKFVEESKTRNRRKSKPPAGTPPAGLAKVRLVAGEPHKAAVACMDAVVKADAQIYRRGAALVFPTVIPKPRRDKTGSAPAGALVLEPVTETRLVVEFAQAVYLEKFDARAGEFLRVDPPPRLAKAALAMPDYWPFPVLAGVIEAPTILPDGTLLEKPGYDAGSGLFLHATNLDIRAPANPTRDDAQTALALLVDLMSDFPFETQADTSVALAAILSAVIRPWLRTAPGFGFDATTPGSGKTLLADIVAMICTGRPAPVLHQGQTDEEMEKRLGAFLLQGHAIMNLDNLERALGGELLCSVLTSPEITVRVLGESKALAVPTNLLFMVTANNLAVKGDLSRRMLVCRLDPRCERPEERLFDRDPYRWVPEHRADLLTACLTILCAFHRAGLPDQGLKPYGSFDDWSRWIRGAVVWLGWPDPCLTRTRLEGADHVTGELGAVLAAWQLHLGQTARTVRDAVAQCGFAANERLRMALLDVAPDRKDPTRIDTRRLSHWLRKLEGRVVSGLCFERGDQIEGRDTWIVGRR